MDIKEKLKKVSGLLELRTVSKEIHNATDRSLRPAVQKIVDGRKLELWKQNRRRGRQEGYVRYAK